MLYEDMYPHIAGINYESACDGPGVRTAIFLSGCDHYCKGCHNPKTWRPSFGTQITDEIIDRIAENITSRPYLSGITLTGGDPLFCTQKTLWFYTALITKLPRIPNLWIYTGFTKEELQKRYRTDSALISLLVFTDKIVEGRFVEELKDKRLAFRGSSNQRIIDPSEILTSGDVAH